MDTLTTALNSFVGATCLGDRVASACDVRDAWIDVLKGEGLPVYKAKTTNAIELADGLIGRQVYEPDKLANYLRALHGDLAIQRRQEVRCELYAWAVEREMC